jgi:hypothetical protein
MHGKRYTNKKMRNILPPNTARFSVFIWGPNKWMPKWILAALFSGSSLVIEEKFGAIMLNFQLYSLWYNYTNAICCIVI